MPVWRGWLYIDRAIKSIVDQSIKEPYELIIIDDGSNDSNRTWGKIESWQRTLATHPFMSLKSIQLMCNAGPGNARRVGIESSLGKYICYLDSDDEFYPNRLLSSLMVFKQNPVADIVLSRYIMVQGNNKAEYDPGKYISRMKEYLQKQNMCIPLGVMHTREIYYKTSGWPKYIVCGEDGILWRRMSEVDAHFDCCAFPSGIYHIRQQSQSRTQRRFDSKMAFAFDGSHPDGTNGQYLDGLSDEQLSRYFEK